MISKMIADIPQTRGRWHIIEYCDRMGDAYAAADEVLSRAGATTLAEIAALGKPALLVPYPHAAADEQTTNAQGLVDLKAADMLADSELDEPVFMEKLCRLITDTRYREDMRAAAQGLENAQARQKLTRLIIELVSGEG
jgi:UDP-N-acetylglucosamine--N-acetylmuramyl-(pentapeptide) pyrophosphoryl-undecaprenol N-acetylglucosamine transferase